MTAAGLEVPGGNRWSVLAVDAFAVPGALVVVDAFAVAGALVVVDAFAVPGALVVVDAFAVPGALVAAGPDVSELIGVRGASRA